MINTYSSIIGILGGGLFMASLIAAPFTAGASIGLAVVGGVVGAVGSGVSIGANVVSKIISNYRLKKVQEHISLDQQLSTAVNRTVSEYNKVAAISGGSDKTAIGMTLATFGTEGMFQMGGLLFSMTPPLANMAFNGLTLVVTVPINIAVIGYNSYLMYQASSDQIGGSEGDGYVKWLIQHIEIFYKGIVFY